MSLPNESPDPQAPAALPRDANAVAREKPIAENGSAPVSLWILTACGLVAITAGGILGATRGGISYASTFPKGYVRSAPPGAAEKGSQPKEALAAFVKRGEKIYSAKCNGCHGPDAKGGAAYPSLVGSKWVLGETDRFAMIILNGLQGPTSTGKDYGVMPSQASGLTPEDLAGVMTYVRNHFGNTAGDIVTPDMAKAAIEISAKRSKAGQAVTGAELDADHAKALPGDPLDPKTLVDPITLKPATAAKP